MDSSGVQTFSNSEQFESSENDNNHNRNELGETSTSSPGIVTQRAHEINNVVESEPRPSALDPFALKSALFLRITPAAIQKYLCTNYTTKTLLKVCRNKVLTNQQSDAVVDVIVNQLLLINSKWEHAHFARLADNITKVFTEETVSTYFTAAIKKQDSKTGQSIPPKGKIPDKFKNISSLSRKVSGQTKKRKKSSSNSPHKVPKLSEQADDVQESVRWLKESSDPEDDLLAHWSTTSKFRNQWIMANRFSVLSNIFEQWSQLTDKKLAPKLIDIDFKNLFTRNPLDIEIWSKFIRITLKYYPPTCENGKSLQDLSELESTSENLRVISQLLMLPNLIAPKNRYKNGNPSLNNKRCTVTGAKDSLVIMVNNESQLLKKREEMRKSTNQPIQPHIIVIGSLSPGKITKIFVSVDNYLYAVSSAIKAIDTCFKFFHVLNADYPSPSQHIWTLIQEAIYKYTVPNAERIPHIERLLNLLNKNLIVTNVESQDDA